MELLLRDVALVAGDAHFVDIRAKLERRLPEAREIMTLAEELREEGRQEGYREGREEGREEGHQEGYARALLVTLTKLLALRFGPLVTLAKLLTVKPGVTAIDITTADIDELERYIHRAFIVDTLEAVFAAPEPADPSSLVGAPLLD